MYTGFIGRRAGTESMPPFVGFQLTLFETGAMERGGSVRKLKRNAQSLFRGEMPDIVDLPLSQHAAKLTRTPRRIQFE